MRFFLAKSLLLLPVAGVLSAAAGARGQTCTYSQIDHSAPEVWKKQLCTAPTFTTAPLSFTAVGTYLTQYLGKLQGGNLNSTASVTATLLGASPGVIVSNVTLSATPPPTAPQGDSGTYLYGDITIGATATAGQMALILSVMQEGAQIVQAVDALSLQRLQRSSCQQDVTSQLSISSSQPMQLFGTQLYTQVVTLKNVGSTSISGPLLIAINKLSTNAQLFGSNGTLPCGAYTGTPFQYAGTGLAAGAIRKVVLTFTNSLVPQSNITYQPLVLAGSQQPS